MPDLEQKGGRAGEKYTEEEWEKLARFQFVAPIRNSLLYARLCNKMSPILEQSRCSFVLLSFSRVGNASLLTRQDVDPNYVCTRIVSPEYTCVWRHPRISGSKSSSEHEYSPVLFLSTRKCSLKSFRPSNFQIFRANILCRVLFYYSIKKFNSYSEILYVLSIQIYLSL